MRFENIRRPSWMVSDQDGHSEYWVLKRRWPEWVFFVMLAVWPALRGSVVRHRRWCAGFEERVS